MKVVKRLMFLAVCCSLTLGTVSQAADAEEEAKPKVEVVFCLDTTGSMGGLIEGAKQKIWSISNQILSGKPTPDLKIGLVGYRDRTDAYITKVTQLTDDLDAIHAELKKFKAAGGGDGPESVNQALDDAVNKIKWSKDAGTLKIIFLVGDAPPHMDYKDDVKYPETCQKAVKNNIIINTVQCGRNASATKVWQDISRKSEGSYVAIAQNGGVVAVTTPFDKELSELNSKVTRTAIVYGSKEKRRASRAKAEEAAKLPSAPGASRAGAVAKSGKVVKGDLLDDLADKKVKLNEIKDTDLPAELKALKPAQREGYLKKISAERQKLNKKIIELDKKRTDYIKKELEKKKGKGKDSFDSQVLEMLRKQAKKHNIKY